MPNWVYAEGERLTQISEGGALDTEHWAMGGGCPVLIVIPGHRSLEDAGQLLDINYTQQNLKQELSQPLFSDQVSSYRSYSKAMWTQEWTEVANVERDIDNKLW